MSKDGPPKTSAQEAREVGDALRALRERRGFTQERAAEALRVSRTAWQNYESGRPVVLRTDMQLRLAQALGAKREDLLAILREQQGATASHSAFGVEETGMLFSGPGRQQAIFPLSEGDVIVSYPAGLTPDGFQELNDYLELFLKRARA